MEISQASHDRYSRALSDYEKIVKNKWEGWEAYVPEIGKLRLILANTTIREEVVKVLWNA